jgi:hypothetical protein
VNRLAFLVIVICVTGCASPSAKVNPTDKAKNVPKVVDSAKKISEADKAAILEKRKAEVLRANAESPRHKQSPLCGQGGTWGYFTQDPKRRVDGWDISHVKGNFKTFNECEAARKQLKKAFFTERCEAKSVQPKRTYEVILATFHDYGGNRHEVYFSTIDKCKKALSEGIYWYHVVGYQNGEEEVIDFVESQGKGSDSFNPECEIVELDACNELDGRINLQL